jgi:hypothetical protein
MAVTNDSAPRLYNIGQLVAAVGGAGAEAVADWAAEADERAGGGAAAAVAMGESVTK